MKALAEPLLRPPDWNWSRLAMSRKYLRVCLIYMCVRTTAHCAAQRIGHFERDDIDKEWTWDVTVALSGTPRRVESATSQSHNNKVPYNC